MPPSTEDTRLSSPAWWPFWLAFAAALALRLLWLDLRPLHHDEGVNGWFLFRLLDGYRWAYDPERFHGPFLYFFGAPFALLLGMSETVLRLPVALASSAMIPLLLPLRRRLGRAGPTGITATAWLLAVSPSLVSYGRDLIHETCLVVLTLALVALVSRWLEERRDEDLVWGALFLSLLFTVKETAALTAATLALAAIVVWWAAGRPPIGERLWEVRPGTWKRVALALVVPYVFLYTSFFTNPGGLVDSFRAYLPWTEKGFEGSGHEKPWPYFFELLGTFEPLALAGAVLGGAVAVWRRHPFGIFCAVWGAGQLLLYSAIPYKTPWLVLNMVLPLALCAGVLFEEIGRRALPGAARAAITGLGLLLVTWTAAQAVKVSFLRYDDESLGLVYVQTTRELRDLMRLIEGAAARSPMGKDLAIRFYTNNRWPLPWYLRDYPGVLYLKQVPVDPSGDVLLCDPGEEKNLLPRLRDTYVRHEYTLRKNVKLMVYVRQGLEPGALASLLQSAGSAEPVPG